MIFDINKFAKKYNVDLHKAQSSYPEALKTAKEMGLEKDPDYIEDTLKDLLNIEESIDVVNLANKFIESESFDKFYEEIVSTGIPQNLRPERIVKNAYNFPNDEWNKSKDKRDVYKYKTNKEAKEPEADSVPKQTPIMISNY
jgi:hypothetical protein